MPRVKFKLVELIILSSFLVLPGCVKDNDSFLLYL